MVKRSTGCKRSPGGQVIVGAKGVRFPDADAILKHIGVCRTLIKTREGARCTVCFNMVTNPEGKGGRESITQFLTMLTVD
jgi:hypothetical protein